MTYRDNVEQAATALKRGEDANWELARLTYENTVMGGGRPTDGRVSMYQWAADVRAASGRRFSDRTAKCFKDVWELRLTGHPSAQLGWSGAYNEVRGGTTRDRIAEYEAGGTKATPETKREVFQQLAADPDVIDEAAVLGTPTSRAVSELYTRTERVRAEHRERAIEADPIAKELDEVGAAIALEAACNRFARDLETMSERFVREINAALPRAGEGREQHLYWIRQAMARSRAVLDKLESYAETGRSDLDTFLSDVLGGR